MFELQGKYGTAKVFTDVVEQTAIAQVINLLNQPYVEGSHVRMMPDIHVGAGCTIGATMTIKDKACPNLVGVDIGCGMETARLREDHIDLQKLDQVIRAKIPSGFDIQEKVHPFARKVDLSKLYCANKLNLDHAYNCLGTLGGGNHFIEANRDDDGNIYIVIHSGSRHLGKKVAMYYQKAGYWDDDYQQVFVPDTIDIEQYVESRTTLEDIFLKDAFEGALTKLGLLERFPYYKFLDMKYSEIWLSGDKLMPEIIEQAIAEGFMNQVCLSNSRVLALEVNRDAIYRLSAFSIEEIEEMAREYTRINDEAKASIMALIKRGSLRISR